ncbi:hypothetical protein TNCV_2375991 [Trichonephila clavipes]|nr:hypothetical protein TNCV_2375991 [Trichonephila clavipes]
MGFEPMNFGLEVTARQSCRDRRFGDNFLKELQFVPISYDSGSHRNEDIAENVGITDFREALAKEMSPADDELK